MSAKKPAPKRASSARKPKTPVKPRWAKGQSGNPSGQPQKFTSLISQAIRKNLGAIAPGEKRSYAEAIGKWSVVAMYKSLKQSAESGEISNVQISFLDSVMDRMEGRIPVAITLPDMVKKLDGLSIEELEAVANNEPSSAG